MKHLITRKIGLGVLVAFVLALGVQGVVEAQNGIIRTVSVNEPFVLSGSVDIRSSEAKNPGTRRGSRTAFEKAAVTASTTVAGFEQDVGDTTGITAANAHTFYYYDAVTTPAVSGGTKATTTRTWLTESAAYYFNDEALIIRIDPADSTDVTLTRNGTTIPFIAAETTGIAEEKPTDDEASLYETAAIADRKLPSRISLNGRATAAGVYRITIGHDIHADDVKPGILVNKRTNEFTLFVVDDHNSGATGLSFSGLDAENYKTGGTDFSDETVTTAVAPDPDTVGHLRITYKVVQGSGRLYVEEDGFTAPSTPTSGQAGNVPPYKSSAVTTLSTSTAATVKLDMNGATNKVQASISGQSPTTAIFIFGYPNVAIVSGNNQDGVFGGRLDDPLVVSVKDGKNRPISGLAAMFDTEATGAMFIPVPGTTVYTTDTGALTDTLTDAITETATVAHGSAADLIVQTDSRGEAKTYFQLGRTDTETRQRVTVSAGGSQLLTPFNFNAATGTRKPIIEIFSGNNQRTDQYGQIADPLVVVVRQGGHLKPNEVVEFRAGKGTLGGYTKTSVDAKKADSTAALASLSANRVYGLTDSSGRAQVTYEQRPNSGSDTVTASISGDTYEREAIFGINGGRTTGGDDDDDDTDITPTLSVSPTSITGAAGSTQSLSVSTSAGARISVSSIFDSFITAGGSVSPTTGTGSLSTTLTLPSSVGTYSLTVFAGTSSNPSAVRQSVSVTVTAAQPTGGTVRISSISPGSGAPGTTSTVTVSATDANGNAASGVTVTLSITAGGGTLVPSSVTTGTTGTATAILTRGSTPGSNYFITASPPTGYTFAAGTTSGERFHITGTQQQQQQQQQQQTTAGEPAAIDVYNGNQQSGSLNVQLPDPFIVEVVDANDDPVENVRVRFRVTQGSGRLSPRTPRTDEDGFAATRFTPTSAGRIRIEATVADVDDVVRFTVEGGDPADALVKVSGDNQSGTPGRALANPFVVEVQDEDGDPLEGHRVSFEVTAGGGSLSETSATTGSNGRAETTLTLGRQVGINSVEASVSGVDPVTFSTSIEPKVLVAATNRPVMYWIDGGALYRLAGAKASKIADSVNGVAVGSDKIYWTSTTGASAGTINSANLDGSGVEELKSIMAVPMGIGVDTAGSKLYWTNSRGKIQSANLNGTRIQDVLQNLSDPTDIAIGGGYIYWIEDGNSIRRVSISGQKTKQDVAVNLGTVGGLAVGGGKVYWTEATGASAGTINGANLNGTQFSTLKTIASVPMGIGVDTAGSRLYWTNNRGRVQSGDLTVSRVTNVVEGLISPTKLTIGGANTAGPITRQPTQQPSGGDTSAYDVNGDGTVDNTDAALVAGAMNTDNAQYDVNGDGTVNFLDLLLVFDNRDADAAGAPTVVGMQLSAVQIDVIEEQIDLLIATGDRSPAAMRTLVYLQQLIATARPEKTQLFANFPNPFNPETWIPYELATDTDVRITIYNAQGVVIRTLQLGQQSAGYYTDRERAAYWDGRNAFGEQVASGVYFYQLETDDMSALRKMVILK